MSYELTRTDDQQLEGLDRTRAQTEASRQAGAQLRAMRLQRDLYQSDVARATEQIVADYPVEPLDTQDVSRIERGYYRNGPHLDQIALFGAVLGMSPQELFQLYNLPVEKGSEIPPVLQRAYRIWRVLENSPTVRADFEARIRQATEQAMLQQAREKR